MKHFIALPDRCICGSYKYIALREHEHGFEVYLIEHRHVQGRKDSRKYKRLASFRKLETKPCLFELEARRNRVLQVVDAGTKEPVKGAIVSYLGVERVTNDDGMTKSTHPTKPEELFVPPTDDAGQEEATPEIRVSES